MVELFKFNLISVSGLFLLFFCSASLAAVGNFAEPAAEPQVLDPEIDRNLIRSFLLDSDDGEWDEPVINILLVGQDGQLDLPYPFIKRENGSQVKRLSTRADASILLSFNRRTGRTSLFSIERHNLDRADNEILAHQYIIKGRSHYIQRVKERVEVAVRQLRIEAEVLDSRNQLHIHGLLELDFQIFKRVVVRFRENLLSSARFAWAFKGHSVELLTLLKEDNLILRKLRARQNFRSGSYQRSLNHALFLSSVLGILSYSIVESGETELLQSPIGVSSFSELSRTFSFQQLVTSLTLQDGVGHVLERTGFKNGYSTTDVYLLGIDPESYASYISGHLKVNVPARAKNSTDSLLFKLDPELGQFLKVKNCVACLK